MSEITTPQSAAYELLKHIAIVENKDITGGALASGKTRADRKWILETYFEALEVAKGCMPSGYTAKTYQKE